MTFKIFNFFLFNGLSNSKTNYFLPHAYFVLVFRHRHSVEVQVRKAQRKEGLEVPAVWLQLCLSDQHEKPRRGPPPGHWRQLRVSVLSRQTKDEKLVPGAQVQVPRPDYGATFNLSRAALLKCTFFSVCNYSTFIGIYHDDFGFQ